MKDSRKVIVMTFLGQYLPGFKAGGTLRSVANLVDHLSPEFEFRVVTRDRDLGDTNPYVSIAPHVWHQVGKAFVYYFRRGADTLCGLRCVITGTEHHVLYLNSYFEPFTVKVLALRRLFPEAFCAVIVAPRGEFAWASLRQKYIKKCLYIQIAGWLDLYRGVMWHASSNYEADEICAALGVPRCAIHLAMDLPMRFSVPSTATRAAGSGLRVVFLSRISQEKNLDFALRVLAKSRCLVTFDIIGPVENSEYWQRCARLMASMPPNIIVRAQGPLHPSMVSQTLAGYDLMLFPSGGENYGHVIAEALCSGVPVLISQSTPWRNLESWGLGWDLPLNDELGYVRIIEMLAGEDASQRAVRRDGIKRNIGRYMDLPARIEQHASIFRLAVASKNRTFQQAV